MKFLNRSRLRSIGANMENFSRHPIFPGFQLKFWIFHLHFFRDFHHRIIHRHGIDTQPFILGCFQGFGPARPRNSHVHLMVLLQFEKGREQSSKSFSSNFIGVANNFIYQQFLGCFINNLWFKQVFILLDIFSASKQKHTEQRH